MKEMNLSAKQLALELKKGSDKGIIGVVEGDLLEGFVDDLVTELDALDVPYTFQYGRLVCGSKTLN